MQEYETEEQQIEALKKWWKENSSSLLIGLAIGLAAIAGWKTFTDYTRDHSQQASDMYIAVNEQVKQNNFTDKNKLESLTSEYKDTPYAALAALSVAKYYYEKGEVEAAIKQLQWAEQNTDVEETRHIARLRLATVYIADSRLEQAEALLNQAYPAEFTARYEELKGDLYVAMGDDQQARAAYDKAILAQGLTVTPWLKMKRNNVGATIVKSEPVS